MAFGFFGGARETSVVAAALGCEEVGIGIMGEGVISRESR